MYPYPYSLKSEDCSAKTTNLRLELVFKYSNIQNDIDFINSVLYNAYNPIDKYIEAHELSQRVGFSCL